MESLYPGKARTIADNRIKQLATAGKHVAAMCPICLLNLREAARGQDIEVCDISQYLVAAVCGVENEDINHVATDSRVDTEVVTHAG